jgi:periplasmic protein TonB
MFFFDANTRRTKWNWPMCVSVGGHLLLLAFLLVHRPAPMFVTPVSVVQGNGKTSYHLIYLSPYGNEDSDSTEHQEITAKASSGKLPAPKRERRRPAPVNLQQGSSNDLYARAGTPYGSLLTGPTDGPEIKPALPVVFPDPPISRSEFDGKQGDVIVEITIDTAGRVADMKLLHSMERGIDERVMATLRNWQFRPATMDGRPVASKHDVHFHFPS